MHYLQQWGMGANDSPHKQSDDHDHDHDHVHHPYLDYEWKNLSGGESQRTILAMAMASRPQILLLDEATAGLDSKMELRVEESVVEYAKTWGAAVLWVTHSEDITERLLKL